MRKWLDSLWWQNKLKYTPLFQRFFLFWTLSDDFPRLLNIEVTNACNLRCVFCPRHLTNRKIGFMKRELFEKIIGELAQQGPIEVLWLMKDGESFLHPHLSKFITLAAEKKVAKRIELYSNGMLLDQKMAPKILTSGLDVLNISLDAGDKKTFLKLKGVDAYDKIVKNIKDFAFLKKKLKVKRPLLAVKMVRVKENRGQEKKFKRLWSGIADNVVIQKPHSWEGSIDGPGVNEEVNRGKRRYPCNLPWLAPAINWDGKVTSCCVNFKQNELILGDVRRQSLKEIYQGKKFRDLRKAHLNQDFRNYPTCKRCPYWQQLPGMGWRLRHLKIP